MEVEGQEKIDSETLKKIALEIFENNKAKFLEYLEERIKNELENNKEKDDDISIPILDKSFYKLINGEIKKVSKIPINTIKSYEIVIYDIIRDNLKCELLASDYIIKSRLIILRKKSRKKKLQDMLQSNYLILCLWAFTYTLAINSSIFKKEILDYFLKIKLVKFSIYLLITIVVINDLIHIIGIIINRKSEHLKPILKEIVDLSICTVILVIIEVYIYNL